jgi:uncharacterized membrane protein
LDAPLYSDIRPLFPLTVNPFYNPNLDFAVGNLCVLLLFTGSLLYLRILYRNLLSRADKRVAGVCTGMVATLLGLIALTTMLLNLAYILPSLGLVFWGLLAFYNSLKGLDPSRRTRIIVSETMMLVAVSALCVLMLRSSRLGLGEQFISELFLHFALYAVLFGTSWFTSLISIVLLRPVFHRFSLEAGDGSFKLLVDLLTAGWVLMFVFIGVLIVAPILLAILMKTPTVLARFLHVNKKCLRPGT